MPPTAASTPTRPTATESLASAAARHGISTRTLRRRIAAGQLTAYRLGPALLRVSPAEVDALLRPVPTAGTAA